MSHAPIAYTYEADHHCPSCAEKRFGINDEGYIEGEDSEGNPVGVIAPWGDWTMGTDECEMLGCSTCGAILEYAHVESCPSWDGGHCVVYNIQSKVIS